MRKVNGILPSLHAVHCHDGLFERRLSVTQGYYFVVDFEFGEEHPWPAFVPVDGIGRKNYEPVGSAEHQDIGRSCSSGADIICSAFIVCPYLRLLKKGRSPFDPAFLFLVIYPTEILVEMQNKKDIAIEILIVVFKKLTAI